MGDVWELGLWWCQGVRGVVVSGVGRVGCGECGLLVID